MKADLHIHTTCSDGSLSPKNVVLWAKRNGLNVLSVTDHDAIDGLDEAMNVAKDNKIAFVSGIELSTFSICEIHVLGYNIDYHNADFLTELQAVKDMRVARNIRIGKRLDEFNIKLDIDFSAQGLGRMNMARQIVKQGYCRDINEVFEKYLGINGKAYCEAKRMTPIEAVKLIKKYGGFASLAHPKKYLLDKRLDMLVGGLKRFGLDGLELNYPGHTEQDRLSLMKICTQYQLLPTGGSDFHGDEDKNFVFNLDERTRMALGISAE